jgi:type II secretion system protein C
MTPMLRRLYSAVNWNRQAPRWTAVLLASLMAADLGSTAAGLRTTSVAPPAPPARPHDPARTVTARAWRVSNAHLFGNDKAPARSSDPGNAPETQLTLALTGTLATRDPNQGYAILGEKGKAAHLYHTGGALGDGLSGRLYQTFTDRVVLELNGQLETLKLPRQVAPGLVNAPSRPETVAAADAGPILTDGAAASSAAEQWFELLHPQNRVIGNQSVGIKLRPDMRLQREFDLRFNDVLTAVNGVEISGPNSFADLESALKGASGKTLSLTVMRDGVQQMLTVPVAN